MQAVRNSLWHRMRTRIKNCAGAAGIVAFVLFVLYALSILYPVFWAIVTSFKSYEEYAADTVAFPTVWHFENYADAFTSLVANGVGMFGMLLNSLWYTIGGAGLGVAVSSMTAYAVSKYRFPGGRILYWVALVTMMIPIVGAIPSQYKIYNMLGILNSPAILVSFANGFGFNFIVQYSFYKNISWTYAEAAQIDGAGNFRIFFTIMLPQALGLLAALFLVSSINFWNDYMGPFLFMPFMPTLAAGLFLFQYENAGSLDIPVLFAGSLMSIIPIFLLFVFFQEKLMNMTLGGGIKG
ncbi:MAG TPA: carbohydrate ABC transporter permease [Candidatus Borkfalkia avicola]|uniref:Carbohydrate ABC transporter permease n=1 Tax=Candidatus Borkfalkia avicola TaxID=2838503 RepID=A0A9D2D689_9FIRM|nr:carbohydrate ABC transporter permease [Candidatus Borkfalkia avicola]